jgi:hypothetical protein
MPPVSDPKSGRSWKKRMRRSGRMTRQAAEVLQLLFDRTPPASRVVEACWIEDETAARRYQADVPDVAGALSVEAVELLLQAGAKRPAAIGGTAPVRALLERH